MIGEKNDSDQKEIMEKMKNIIINAAKYYDQVFVDLKKETKYSEQTEILNMSDIIVFNVEQKFQTIENVFENEEFQKHRNKVIWNICKYDRNSKYNIKNLSRTILKKQTICQTNYNTQVFDTTQEGNLPELLLKFRTIREDEENVQFINNMKKLSEEIILRYQNIRSGI